MRHSSTRRGGGSFHLGVTRGFRAQLVADNTTALGRDSLLHALPALHASIEFLHCFQLASFVSSQRGVGATGNFGFSILSHWKEAGKGICATITRMTSAKGLFTTD